MNLFPNSWTLGFMPWIIADIVGVIVILVVSKYTKPLPAETVNAFFDIWEPNKLSKNKVM